MYKIGDKLYVRQNPDGSLEIMRTNNNVAGTTGTEWIISLPKKAATQLLTYLIDNGKG